MCSSFCGDIYSTLTTASSSRKLWPEGQQDHLRLAHIIIALINDLDICLRMHELRKLVVASMGTGGEGGPGAHKIRVRWIVCYNLNYKANLSLAMTPGSIRLIPPMYILMVILRSSSEKPWRHTISLGKMSLSWQKYALTASKSKYSQLKKWIGVHASWSYFRTGRWECRWFWIRQSAWVKSKGNTSSQQRVHNQVTETTFYQHIFDSVKASLKRLDVEYIDLLQCHRLAPATGKFPSCWHFFRFDEETPIEETVRHHVTHSSRFWLT